MALQLTQPLTEMSIRNLTGSKGRLARKADTHTAICEPIFVNDCDGHGKTGSQFILK
jgi:hypothetical protein